MRVLAIDFGTSNTVAALLIEGQAPRTVTFDASPLLPSAVYLDPDGQLTVGRDAQRLARLDPTRFEPNPKRRIDDGEVLLGDRAVPVVQLIGAVLRTVAVEVRRQLGGAPPDEVRLTHPAQWGASRQNVLVSAARAAGLGANLLLIAEPVAAAAQFTRLPGRALPPGGTVAVYDLGGGTFDIAIVGRTLPAPGVHATGLRSTGQHSTAQNGAAGRDGEFHVLAEAGLPDLGGLDFDQAILEHVGRVTSATDPAHWQRILRPADASGRRAARALAEDVRAAKETLSRYPQTEITLPDPFGDAHLTRSEFEGLIRPNLLRSIEVLTSVLRGAGIAPDRLGGIFLVGGSSRIPLVAALIQDRLHLTPVALDQPETAVALGALLVPVRREGNRTVAMSGGRPPVGGPGPGGLQAVGGQPATGGRTGSNGPAGVSGGGMQPARPVRNDPSSARSGGRRSTGRRSRAILVGAAAFVVLVGLLLIVTKPFGSNPAAAPGSTTAAAASGVGTGPSAATASRAGTDSPKALSSNGSGIVAISTGLGPGKLFSAGEMDFVGPSINRLTNCIDTTNGFNKVVKPLYQVARAVQCQVAEADLPTQFYGDRAFVYVMTPLRSTGDGGGRYLDQIYAGRSEPKKDSDLESHDIDKTVSAGELTARYVAIYQLPALSADAVRPSSVLGWTYVGRPYVGLVVTSGSTLQDELVNFWAQTYRPRG